MLKIKLNCKKVQIFILQIYSELNIQTLSIDLDNTAGRKQYLSEKLDDLLDGINESYGTVLMEELLNRLELTIKDFNDEMKTLCDQMVIKQEERQHLLEMLRSKVVIQSETVTVTDSESADNALVDNIDSDSDDDTPVWEKKLAKLEKK